MHPAKEEIYGKKALAICRALERRNIKGIFVNNCQEACEQVLNLVPRGADVALGGSLTLKDCGIIDALRKGNFNLIDRYQKNLSKEETKKLLVKGLTADVFISGTNAITQDGKLVNIDGTGNRVAALLYGPKKVIIVCGVNKIVEDVEAGIRRIKHFAAPFNCARLKADTPCAKSGICNDAGCRNPARLCNEIAIIEGQREPERMTIIIVGQELGF